MCGICGYVGLDDRELAEAMTSAITHRGPDDAGIFHGPGVALGHRRLSVIDLENWEVVATIDMLGPGFFLRSHETSPYVWADVFFGPNSDAIHVIDKETLEIVRTLRPIPGATAAHVEFDRWGKYALVSIWEDDGALIVYDAATLEEVRRLPMRKPSGKYNVWNKITFSDGTSH